MPESQDVLRKVENGRNPETTERSQQSEAARAYHFDSLVIESRPLS